MASFLRSLFGGPEVPAPRPAREAPFENGNLYSFRTIPLTEFSAPETGRYGAFKVLRLKGEDQMTVAVLDGIWGRRPALSAVRRLPILRKARGAWNGTPAIISVPHAGADEKLRELTLLGTAPVSDDELALADSRKSYSALETVSYDAEAEWRWKHDRARLEAEEAQEDAAREARDAARAGHVRTRLDQLTFDQLLAETPLPRWAAAAQLPAEFIRAAREALHDTCRKLRALGPKPGRARARTILKGCVLRFNAIDERAGGVIETTEREDICDALCEIAYVARHPVLAEEIHQWRDW